MKNRIVIAIGREYGSGGREIGKRIADDLGIPFYDKELIAEAAKQSGISAKLFESVDEQATNSLLYSLSLGLYTSANPMANISDVSMNDKLFLIQSDVIRKLAEEGSCVIVGRCSDYVLRDDPNLLSVFVHADLDYRKKMAIEKYGDSPENIEEVIRKIDKKRANYYSFYTDRKWGRAQNSHLSLNSGVLGLDNCVKIIKAAAEMRSSQAEPAPAKE